MNDQTQQALAKMLDNINSGIDNASNFTLEQIPDILNQLIVFKTVFHGAWSVVGLVLMIASAWVFVWAIIQKNNDKKWTIDRCFNKPSDRFFCDNCCNDFYLGQFYFFILC